MARENINSDYISIGRAAYLLGVSDHTITRWYKWWGDNDYQKPSDLYLPPFEHKDRRGTKFFKKSDIPHLKEFRNAIQTTHKGCMAEFNAAYQWGKRGEQITERRRQKKVIEIRRKECQDDQ